MVWLVLVGLVACGGKDTDSADRELTPEERWGPPTDTVPSFYGSVPKNIVMLSIDTFRRDSLSQYGGPPVMPYLDSLAESGFTADDHLTASNWTMHGTSSTLAGAYPLEFGWMPSLSTGGRTPMPEAPTLLAEALHDAGYWSVLISGNSWLSPEWNNTQGYDFVDSPEDYDHAPMLADDAFEALEAAQASGAAPGPWFMHLHLMEPHAAYRPPKEYLTGLDGLPRIDIDLENRDEQYFANVDWLLWPEETREVYEQHLWVRYRGELTYEDDLIEKILDEMDFRGMLKDTLVVVWNDHGEAMFEHGVQSHAWTLHGPENDGVWLMWAKNIVPGRWSGPTSAIDMSPTLLTLLGKPVPASMTGLPLGQAPVDRPRYGWSFARGPHELSVSKGGWKLIYQVDGAGRLYDRNVDPLEEDNLWDKEDPGSHPKVQELWPLLAPRMQTAVAFTEDEVEWPPGLEPAE
ncbi:MAG: arylsulfatase A-like enzyme [Myxococcota bacterium]|jgi:arylsulfatase A-like enzyme